MDRRALNLAVIVASLSAASGCQDYNFNPVGHCLIQPGTKKIQVSKVSTADVLFVVDDSGSMLGEQGALATEFPRFLDVLARVNKDRVDTLPTPLPPYDFHVAVTTTSSYYNEPPVDGSVCATDCPGAEGQPVCCLRNTVGGLASPQPPLCAGDAYCDTGRGFSCQPDCKGISEVNFYTANGCCNATSKDAQPIPCDRVGEACGVFDRFYFNDGLCSPGYPQSGAYPAGAFLSDPANGALATAQARGKVLHFDKALPWSTWAWTSGGGYAGTDQTLKDLAGAFANNISVGTCGSPQEQGLEVARRAIKGLLGQDGLTQSVGRSEWLHDDSKLVVVWVSDEDDCSAPFSAGDGVVFPRTVDGCAADAALPAAQQREYSAASYADYFTSLGRPFGAAFIVSATCKDDVCTAKPGDAGCVDPTCSVPPNPPGTCGGQAPGTRYLALANELLSRDVEMTVVESSVCTAFGDSLGKIARIVTPPATLDLPTPPAATEVTVLRIANAEGDTLRTCSRPAGAAPAESAPGVPWTNATAQAYISTLGAFDWWYVAAEDPKDPANWIWKLPSGPSRFVFINHASGRCEASGGEVYSLDYLGRVPAPWGTEKDCPKEDTSQKCKGGCASEQECIDALGGRAGDWTCFVGYDPTTNACIVADPDNRGTCICGAPGTHCPNG